MEESVEKRIATTMNDITGVVGGGQDRDQSRLGDETRTIEDTILLLRDTTSALATMDVHATTNDLLHLLDTTTTKNAINDDDPLLLPLLLVPTTDHLNTATVPLTDLPHPHPLPLLLVKNKKQQGKQPSKLV